MTVRLVPRERVGGDDTLGLVGREEEPVPPRLGEAGVRALECLEDRDAVQDGERRDSIGMVERRAVGDVAAAVVSDHGKAFVPEPVHKGDDVAAHRPVAVDTVRRIGCRLGRLSVTAQVGTHDPQACGCQQRRDPVPGRMGPRVPMQQHPCRSNASAPHAHADAVGDGDVLEREAGEDHPASMPDEAGPGANASTSSASASPRVPSLPPCGTSNEQPQQARSAATAG